MESNKKINRSRNQIKLTVQFMKHFPLSCLKLMCFYLGFTILLSIMNSLLINHGVVKNGSKEDIFSNPNPKPFCQREQIRTGQWVERMNFHMGTDTSERKNFYVGTTSIPSYANDGKHCENIAITHHMNIAGPQSLHENENGNDNEAVSVNVQFDPYEWQLNDEDTCDFKNEFDPDFFCKSMQNAVLMFIGDSMVKEQYTALINLLGHDHYLWPGIRGARADLSVVTNICANKTTLVFRWSEHLIGIDRYLNETFPTMLVMNTGAHYNTVELQKTLSGNLDIAIDAVKRWQESCREQNLPCHFLWKTTSPGHPNCKNFTEPQNNVTMMEDHIASHPQFQWDKFKENNQMMLKKLESSGLRKNNYDIIDGYAVRCTSNYDYVYRYTNGELRGYPNPTIASSWDPYWNSYHFKVENCDDFTIGPDMPYKPDVEDGQTIRCTTDTGELYRYTNGKRRWYPNHIITSSWDPNWDTGAKVIDCEGVVKGPDMAYKPDVEDGQAMKCHGNYTNLRL